MAENRKISIYFSIDILDNPEEYQFIAEAKKKGTLSKLIVKAIKKTYIDEADMQMDVNTFTSHREEFISLLTEVKHLLLKPPQVQILQQSYSQPVNIGVNPIVSQIEESEGISISDFMQNLN